MSFPTPHTLGGRARKVSTTLGGEEWYPGTWAGDGIRGRRDPVAANRLSLGASVRVETTAVVMLLDPSGGLVAS